MSASTRIKSLPSREGAFFIDVKEIKSINAKYEYQYYVPEEKIINTSIINVTSDFSSISNSVPSYIRINIEKPNFDETDNEDNNITFFSNETDIENFFNQINLTDSMIFTENDFGGNLFTGIKSSIPNEISILRNLIKESTEVIISPASGSEGSTYNSTTDFIRSFANTANTDNFLFSRQSKSKLEKLFNNISTEALGKSDITDPVPYLGYSFSGNFNSVILADIEKSVSENSTSIFANAINDVRVKLFQIQNEAISQKTNEIPLSNYYPYFDSNKIITDQTAGDTLFGNTSNDFNNNTQLFRNIRHIGYRLNVRFIDFEGKVFNLDPTIFRNPNLEEFFVTNPPYGGQASIFMEPLYAIKIPVIKETQGGRVRTSGVAFIAGTGKNIVINIKDTIPPPPPQDLVFNVASDGLEINWSLPFNTQRDITKFRIYKRQSKNDPFTMIHQISFDAEEETIVPSFLNEVLPAGNVKTFYIDNDFNENSKFIYAVSAVDVHGLQSDYSEQIEVSINPVFNRLETKLFSRPGAFLSYPNSKMEKEIFTDVVKSSGYAKMNVYFNPDFLRVYKRDNQGVESDLLNINPNQQKKFKINLINIDLQQNQNIDIIISEGINISPFDSGDSAVIRSFLEPNN